MTPETTPRPVDPDILVLSLANGLEAWVRHHHRPQGTVMMWLHVGCGSLLEEEEERGAAHFLEHLFFRGTERFPPGAAERFFADLGTRLGVHHNALTGLERTCVSLTLPAATAEVVDRALLLLADITRGLSLLPAEVEGQRRVILEEMQARNQVQTRVSDAVARALVPGSLAPRRHPIGTFDSVSALTVEELHRFYRRHYRPDSSRLLVVGDVEPDEVAPLVERHFVGWPRPSQDRFGPDPGIVPLAAPRAAVVRDAGLGEAQVAILAVRPRDRQRTVGELAAQLVEGMATWLVSRRLSNLVREGKAPFRGPRLQVKPLLDVATVASATASGPVESTAEIQTALLAEVRRARLHGFLPEELEVARRTTMVVASQDVTSEPNRASGSVLRDLVEAVHDGLPPMARTQRRELLSELLERVTTDDLAAALRQSYDPDRQLHLAAVPRGVAGDAVTEIGIMERLREVEATPLGPPAVVSRPDRLVDRLPPPGSVLSARVNDGLQVLTLTLSNGAHVHLRPMDFRRQRVFVRITLAGGRVEESPETLGLTSAAGLFVGQPACAGRSSPEVREWLTGQAVTFSGSVQEDCVSVGITGDSERLAFGLELVHALLAAPRLEAPVLTRWRSRLEAQHEASLGNPEAALARGSLALLGGDDHRFRLLEPEDAARVTLDGAQRWLERLAAAPMEVAVVGDFDVEATVELLLRYLGSLPARPVGAEHLEPLRALPIRPGPLTRRMEVAGDHQRGAALVGWRSAPWSAVRRRRLHEVAEAILRPRLDESLRERSHLSYVVDCSYRPSRAYPDASLLAAAFFAPPERLAEGVGLARRVVEGAAAGGPSSTELEAAKRERLEQARQRDLDPRYWVQALSDVVLRGTDLADLKGKLEQLESFTAEDVREALAETVTDEHRIEVTCVPVSG